MRTNSRFSLRTWMISILLISLVLIRKACVLQWDPEVLSMTKIFSAQQIPFTCSAVVVQARYPFRNPENESMFRNECQTFHGLRPRLLLSFLSVLAQMSSATQFLTIMFHNIQRPIFLKMWTKTYRQHFFLIVSNMFHSGTHHQSNIFLIRPPFERITNRQ